MLTSLIQTFRQHPYTILGIVGPVVTWIFNNIVTNAVSSLPAPTKDATQRYIFWFKFLNKFVGNMQRADSTRLEDSPNFQDAMRKAIDNHLASMPVKDKE